MTQTLEQSKTVTAEDLDRLSSARGTLCVSIYIPTHRAGENVQQDRIRLKNAVSAARQQLVEFGMSGAKADSLLEPAADRAALAASDEFWQHQSDGLAILLSDDEVHLFQLYAEISESVSVSDRFFLKPLVRSMNSNEEFHLIACSRNGIRVFRGCRQKLVQEHFEDLPSGVKDVVGDDDQRGHNRHSFKIRPRSGSSSVPHGHVDSHEEADLRQYFREIKDVIGDHLRAHDGPVVFAGVKELLPYFKHEFDCCTVLDEPASGNADHLSEADLLKKSWPLVEQWLHEQKTEQLNRFREASGTEHGSTALEEILPAAFSGRVETLFLQPDVRNYGTCDENGVLHRHGEEASAETSDLHDIAAIRTLRADGRVVFLTPEDGLESPIGAIFRYVI